MNVDRVLTEPGSRIEPPFDPTWDDLTALEWHAAVCAIDSGLPVTVEKSQTLFKGQTVPGIYDVRVGDGTVCNAGDVEQAKSLLQGIRIGAQESRRHPVADPVTPTAPAR